MRIIAWPTQYIEILVYKEAIDLNCHTYYSEFQNPHCIPMSPVCGFKPSLVGYVISLLLFLFCVFTVLLILDYCSVVEVSLEHIL